MLRSISKDVQLSLWTLNARNSLRCRPALVSRHYTPLNQIPDSERSKPKSIPPSSKALPNAPVRSKPTHKAPPTPSLNEAKVTAQKDLTDAQRHGIIPPPPPDAGWAKATLHKLIELLKFYYRGVKLIFTRRKEIAAIRERIKAGGAPLTRAEFRFIQTQKDDVNKVVPFIIIALLLEEVIPLIAIYAPFMLPSTCILPSQRERIEEKRAEKALATVEASKSVFEALKERASSNQLPLVALKEVEGAPTTLCSVLGLSTLGMDALRIRRIRQRLTFITEDDSLLMQDHATLSDHEVKEALAERGLFPSPKSTFAEKRNLLTWWLNAVQNTPSQDAVATRLFLIVSRHTT
ncbi:hypothetical protein CC2G_009165 [Coprinopsis cinerea AmutBmut pab1-1]|nr:hypothetical protein CC2G_009165 [Coprinopsis cinerea AmutBmut pab1-1]